MKKLLFPTALVSVVVVVLTLINQNRLIGLQQDTIAVQREQFVSLAMSCGIAHNLDRAYKQELEDVRYLLGLDKFEPGVDYVKNELRERIANEDVALGGLRGPRGGPSAAKQQTRSVQARPGQVHPGDRVPAGLGQRSAPSAASLVKKSLFAPFYRWAKDDEQ